MDRLKHLWSLYERWRALSEAETEGITTGNWPQVSGCQEGKQKLQDQIAQATRALWDEADSSGLSRAQIQSSLRKMVDELIVAERRNLELVTRQIQEVNHQQEALRQTRKNLHRMQQAYAPRRAQGWVSYS